MIEFDEEKPEEKPKKIDTGKLGKKKKKRKNPHTKGIAKPASWHPSPGKSRVAKGETGKIRGEAGVFLGKRQIQIKIDYSFEEKKYRLEIKSGDGKINETQDCGGIPRVLFGVEKTIKKWRGELV